MPERKLDMNMQALHVKVRFLNILAPKCPIQVHAYFKMSGQEEQFLLRYSTAILSNLVFML